MKMRYSFTFFLVFSSLLLVAPSVFWGVDMREVAQKARKERLVAEEAARLAREEVLNDRTKLLRRMTDLKMANRALHEEVKALQENVASLAAEKESLSGERDAVLSGMKSVSGTIRTAARELDAMLTESPFTAENPERLDTVRQILEPNRFAGAKDLDFLVNGFFSEMNRTGLVSLKKGTVFTPFGTLADAGILSIGPFTALYRDETGKTGYLRFLPENRKYQMLGKEPSRSVRKNIDAYMDGKTDAVYTDVSAGAALQQVLNRSTLKSQIRDGGFLVWPILFIGFLAVLITLERLWFLRRVHANADRVMGRVNALASEKDWEACDAILEPGRGKPV